MLLETTLLSKYIIVTHKFVFVHKWDMPVTVPVEAFSAEKEIFCVFFVIMNNESRIKKEKASRLLFKSSYRYARSEFKIN